MPQAYRMGVYLFGAVSAPSCAIYSLGRAGTDNIRGVSSHAVTTLHNNFYMDDGLKSVESVKDAIKLVNELKSLCEGGGFNLTKWSSNRREVLREIPLEDRAKELKDLDLESSQLPTERTLGVLWNAETDVFQFKSRIKEVKATRRTILSVVSSIYDPLGFIAPLLVPAKSILQETCKLEVGWDDEPGEEVLKKWELWKTNIQDLEGINIPRCYVPEQFGKVIREASTPSQWHHVATKMNPADLASRGVKTTSIFNNSIWFGGPHFLRKKESEWPKQIIARSMEEGDPEVKVSCASLRCEEPTVTDVLVTRISNWLTLRRVMAGVCLATKKFLKLIGRSTGEFEGVQRLTPKLLDESEATIVKDAQRKVYSEEVEALSNGNAVARGSPLFKYSPMLTNNTN
ncbi:hypothetical protein BSL78_25835 [Apostichopus japonicus]|uniref:Uncharacterized protein n=1 Tax=Stichopus japonicus TaxID=307972 RepID=A0A2G8JNJ3_STIJA|nr:hypothetical protein BSL78_25835 [Apostichopus japonicus]